MNYILEDNFDFYGELAKLKPAAPAPAPAPAVAPTVAPTVAPALAPTVAPAVAPALEKKLCLISHEPLTYNAVSLSCNHSFNYLPLFRELSLHEHKYNIHCPYCRMQSNKLIPYIPLPGVTKIVGVNYPTKWCMPAPKCSFVKAKTDQKCDYNGIEYEHGVFCKTHLKYNVDQTWTTDKEQLCKTKSLPELKALLKSKGLKVGGTKKELVNRLFAQ
jgi:hypothetical protein